MGLMNLGRTMGMDDQSTRLYATLWSVAAPFEQHDGDARQFLKGDLSWALVKVCERATTAEAASKHVISIENDLFFPGGWLLSDICFRTPIRG